MVNERTSAAGVAVGHELAHDPLAAADRRPARTWSCSACGPSAPPPRHRRHAASSSSGSRIGCSTPSTPAAAAMPTRPVTTSMAVADHLADRGPRRALARWSVSWKPESSKRGQLDAGWSARRAASGGPADLGLQPGLRPARARLPARAQGGGGADQQPGWAARRATRSGVGPAANRAWSTPVVASSPKAVKHPPSRLRAIVAMVSRGLARQAISTAWPMRDGRPAGDGEEADLGHCVGVGIPVVRKHLAEIGQRVIGLAVLRCRALRGGAVRGGGFLGWSAMLRSVTGATDSLKRSA